jgi:hypothetical protein
MGKSFDDYAAEYKREPFQLPMPGGTAVAVPQPDLKTERAAASAASASGNLADGLMAGLLTYVPEAARPKVEEAWGTLPSTALNAVITEMRGHFGSKNS